jgi:hypothetical protein
MITIKSNIQRRIPTVLEKFYIDYDPKYLFEWY